MAGAAPVNGEADHYRSPSSHDNVSTPLAPLQPDDTSPHPPSPPSPTAEYVPPPAPARPRIMYPRYLPSPPRSLPLVDVATLSLDPSLRGVPPPYILQALREIGPSLRVQPTAANASMPSPTHTLSIHFDDSSDTLQLPVHGLFWAVQSPLLSSLSRAPEPSSSQPSPPPPTLSLHLASRQAFPLLLSYIYTLDEDEFLRGILNGVAWDGTGGSSVGSSPSPSPMTTLDRLAVLCGLWKNVVGLEMGDHNLWDVLQDGWEELVSRMP